MIINGTAYAGKSTMVKLLSNKYNLIHCGENYDCIPEGIITPETNPGLYYYNTMKDWQEFVNRSPDEYDKWIQDCSRELVEFEIMYLLNLPKTHKIIVDTNIPVAILREIADYHQVAIMLSLQSMSVEQFFNRNDLDKAFIMDQIKESPDPEKTMHNYRACIAQINSLEHYNEFANSGFFTILRKDTIHDTRIETLGILAKHFHLDNMHE